MAKGLKKDDFTASPFKESTLCPISPVNREAPSDSLALHDARLHMRISSKLKKDLEDLAFARGIREGITGLIINTMIKEVEENQDLLINFRNAKRPPRGGEGA